jgi:hypothetical protein
LLFQTLLLDLLDALGLASQLLLQLLGLLLQLLHPLLLHLLHVVELGGILLHQHLLLQFVLLLLLLDLLLLPGLFEVLDLLEGYLEGVLGGEGVLLDLLL